MQKKKTESKGESTKPKKKNKSHIKKIRQKKKIVNTWHGIWEYMLCECEKEKRQKKEI